MPTGHVPSLPMIDPSRQKVGSWLPAGGIGGYGASLPDDGNILEFNSGTGYTAP